MVTIGDSSDIDADITNDISDEKIRSKRGVLHFRCDEEMQAGIARVAKFKKMPVGTMVRTWVAERLRQEIPGLPLAEVRLPDGKVLTAESYRGDIERAIEMSEMNGNNLTRKERMTLLYWLDGSVE